VACGACSTKEQSTQISIASVFGALCALRLAGSTSTCAANNSRLNFSHRCDLALQRLVCAPAFWPAIRFGAGSIAAPWFNPRVFHDPPRFSKAPVAFAAMLCLFANSALAQVQTDQTNNRAASPNPSSALISQAGTSGLADTAPQTSDSQLDEVVVSGSKEAGALRTSVASIGKVSRATLKDKKPTFVGQVLNQVAGVYVTDFGNEQHNMSIRQPLSYNAVYLYMEDGIPIRPTGLFNHNATYEINLAGTGEIEVMKGPASSLYGSNAAGGAVNFRTQCKC
jgi:outer membrane receptor for monomeric catechols